MLLRIQLGAFLFVCAAIAVAGVHLSAGTSAGDVIGRAVENGVASVALPQVEREIQATGRVFVEIGPGVNALKRSASGLYYILAAPASVISVYGADGKRRASIPKANSKDAKIVYAEDIDLDVTGRLYVADRGANAIKVFRPDGSLDATIPA